MAVESDLAKLLRGMHPKLHAEAYVFCLMPELSQFSVPYLAAFREAEGWSVVLEESVAKAFGLQPVFRSEWITLNVHSDLHAVGFLAAVSRALANAGIPCNVFSAIHHDHIFVPFEQGEAALRVLESLSLSANA